MLVGVTDKNRNVVGVDDPLAAEQALADMISDGIAPNLVPAIEILPWRRTHVVGVEVYPSSTRPHHVRRLGPQDGVYVRVGATNRRADADLEELGTRFRVTIWREPKIASAIDETDQRILDVLGSSNGLSTRTLAEHIGLTPRATRTRLTSLVERGLVVEIGSGPTDPNRRYYLGDRRV